MLFFLLQLLKTYREVVSNKNSELNERNPTFVYIVQYINDPEHMCTAMTPQEFKNHELQLRAFGHRAAYLIANAVDQIDVHKKSWNSMLVEINRISRAHCQFLLVRNFINAVHNQPQEIED